MLNSSVIKWQQQLLSRGEFFPEGTTADVAIILGYALQRDGTPTPTLQQRVEAGVELFDKGLVDHLLFSGGHPGGGLRNKSEAESMQEYAVVISNRTLPSDRWLLEEQSRSTRENAVNSIAIVAEHRWKSLVVVTSPFHQFRSYWTFRCAVQSLSPDRRMKVWLARVPVEDVRKRGLALQRLYSSWDFYREIAAIVWFHKDVLSGQTSGKISHLCPHLLSSCIKPQGFIIQLARQRTTGKGAGCLS
ncbi:hypothetical protein WJX75_000747 [Coccomyxa subellipsoidea]|uniref:DUF218 domain-containing protein n=1 Tax=Coccomyxa subellipsoidea TaxID=248742 RepID=A0ABR2YQX9_9CHLO